MLFGLDPLTCAFVALGIVLTAAIIIRDRKRGRAVWATRPPNVRERVACAVWLLAFVPAGASYYADWRLFGDYDKWTYFGLFFVGLVLLNRLPGVKRV